MSADDKSHEQNRQAIANAFAELLNDHDYGDVTVAAVIERAGVGRSAFYDHFKTRTDLLRHAVKPLFAVVATAVEPEGASPALIPILFHLRDNPALARVVHNDATRTVLLKVLTQAVEQHQQSPAHMPNLASQIAAAQLALLEPWIMGRSTEAPDALAEQLCRTSRALADAG